MEKKMYSLKKSLALATVVLTAAVLGTGCSSKTENTPQTANAKIAVSSAAVQGDIQSIQLSITDVAPPGAPGAGFPITALLTKSAAGNVWTANVTGIPAAPAPGNTRYFQATAFSGPNATGTTLYQGVAPATVIAGQTAQVTILLQEVNPPAGPSNYAPVIDTLTSTAAFLLPGQGGSFTVTAHDPDDPTHLNRPQFNGEPLAYQWSAACDNGTLNIASPTSATTAFTAPNVPSAICTVSIKVSETALANNSSVTTFFTVTVNGNFGSAQIFAFPNSAPIVTVRGDFRYYFFTDSAPGAIPAEQGDLFFHATDPDGDNVRFNLSGVCSDSGFDATGVLTAPTVPIDPTNFSAVMLVTTTGGSVAPPTADSYDFNPTFGYPTPAVARYADPKASCQFKIQVSDLCTAGDCGPAGSQGSKPDGADRGGSTSGFLNASAPAQPKRAPTILRVNVPNQDGGPVPGTPNSWDPQKFVVVQPGVTVNLSLDAEDTFEAGPLTIAGVCNLGTLTTVGTTQPGGVKTLHWDGTYTAPATLASDMNCVLTVTSTASGLGTATTIRFAGTDPCIGQPDGTACDDHNACTSGTTCLAGHCGGGTTVTCTASDQCHVAGTCDPNTGTCSNPAATDGTSCNADSNGCTVNDSCQAGVCNAGAAAVCNTPPNTFCFGGAGVCTSTGNNSFTCGYTPTTGAACTAANATAKCSGTNIFSSFACEATGVCVGQSPVACTSSQCTTGGSCDPASGGCAGGTNKPNGTTCDDGLACTTGDNCQNGVCASGGPACPAGQSCTEPVPPQTGPQCKGTSVVAQVAKRLDLSTSVGLGIDTAGNSYVTGTLVTPAKTFDGTVLTSAGAGDAFIGSYDASGNKRWVENFGDASDQQPASLAVGSVAGNTLLANGRFSGAIGSVNAGAATWDYLLFLNASTGAITASKSIDTDLSGAIFAVGSNPNLDIYAVCGKATKLALDTSAGAPGTTWATVAGANTYGGLTDIVIGLYDKTGALLWAKQIGTAADEECDSVTIDDVGNVIAAGKYSGSGNLTLAGATPLPNPGSSFRKHIWVAKFNGTTGAGMAQTSFGGGAGSHQVYGIALDASGNIFIGGSFSNNLPFDGTTHGTTACTTGAAGCLSSDGGADGFVAKLDSSFNPLWATRIGVSTADDLIKGVAVDSQGNVTVGGLLNGSATWSNLTPTTVATTPTTDPNLTSAGGSASSFIVKLPGGTGLFSSAAATVTGNATTSNTNHVAINAKGAGTVKDAVSFAGEFAGGTLNFGGSSSAITSPSGASTFLVFAKEQ
jgi:hypothetical protein